MRIIAGLHRSRKLECPEGKDITRPITDRVKQALFDRLASREAIEDNAVLDIFSGVGSMGLECLSRGSKRVTFVEKHPKIIQFLNQNIEMLGYEAESTVLRVDAFSAHWHRQIEAESIGLCFCDPPYPIVEKSLTQVCQLVNDLAPLISQGGWLVLRTPSRTDLEDIPGFQAPEKHRYGGMTLFLFQK